MRKVQGFSQSKRDGLGKTSCPTLRMETGFRFIRRGNDLYKIPFTSCRMKPLELEEILVKSSPPTARPGTAHMAKRPEGPSRCRSN
jgi:hypothetical protein